MVDVKCLSDYELHKHLMKLGFTPGPILRMSAVNTGVRGGVGVCVCVCVCVCDSFAAYELIPKFKAEK